MLVLNPSSRDLRVHQRAPFDCGGSEGASKRFLVDLCGLEWLELGLNVCFLRVVFLLVDDAVD
jgi:hypothetical protein